MRTKKAQKAENFVLEISTDREQGRLLVSHKLKVTALASDC